MKEGLKIERLREWIRAQGSMAVAYSGGLDSTLLVAVAKEELPDDYLAVFVDLPYISSHQRKEALKTAESMSLRIEVVPAVGMEFSAVHRNDRGRCYHCKALIYDAVGDVMERRGLDHMVDGENFSDGSDTRPGRVAAKERGVLSPLAELGVDRDEVESMVKEMGLPVRLGKEACLATRLETDAPWDEEMLDNIEKAEDFLRDIGIPSCRVRVHGRDARIEVPPDHMQWLAGEGRKVHVRLRELGFRHVSLDLKGYRSGSMNE